MGRGRAALHLSSLDDDDDGVADEGDRDRRARFGIERLRCVRPPMPSLPSLPSFDTEKCCRRPGTPALRSPLCRHYLLALSTAALSAIGFACALAAGLSCSFLSVTYGGDYYGHGYGGAAWHAASKSFEETFDGNEEGLDGWHFDPGPATSERATRVDSIGIFCNDDESSRPETLSKAFLSLSLALGFLLLLLTVGISTVLTTTSKIWNGISGLAVLIFIAELPMLMILDSAHCKSADVSCKLSSGSAPMFVSMVVYLVLACWVQWKDRPDWKEEYELWRLVQQSTQQRKPSLERDRTEDCNFNGSGDEEEGRAGGRAMEKGMEDKYAMLDDPSPDSERRPTEPPEVKRLTQSNVEKMNLLNHDDLVSTNTDTLIILNELNTSHEERKQKLSQILREERVSNGGSNVHNVLGDQLLKKTRSNDGPPVKYISIEDLSTDQSNASERQSMASEVTPLARGSGPRSELPPMPSRRSTNSPYDRIPATPRRSGILQTRSVSPLSHGSDGAKPPVYESRKPNVARYLGLNDAPPSLKDVRPSSSDADMSPFAKPGATVERSGRDADASPPAGPGVAAERSGSDADVSPITEDRSAEYRMERAQLRRLKHLGLDQRETATGEERRGRENGDGRERSGGGADTSPITEDHGVEETRFQHLEHLGLDQRGTIGGEANRSASVANHWMDAEASRRQHQIQRLRQQQSILDKNLTVEDPGVETEASGGQRPSKRQQSEPQQHHRHVSTEEGPTPAARRNPTSEEVQTSASASPLKEQLRQRQQHRSVSTGARKMAEVTEMRRRYQHQPPDEDVRLAKVSPAGESAMTSHIKQQLRQRQQRRSVSAGDIPMTSKAAPGGRPSATTNADGRETENKENHAFGDGPLDPPGEVHDSDVDDASVERSSTSFRNGGHPTGNTSSNEKAANVDASKTGKAKGDATSASFGRSEAANEASNSDESKAKALFAKVLADASFGDKAADLDQSMAVNVGNNVFGDATNDGREVPSASTLPSRRSEKDASSAFQQAFQQFDAAPSFGATSFGATSFGGNEFSAVSAASFGNNEFSAAGAASFVDGKLSTASASFGDNEFSAAGASFGGDAFADDAFGGNAFGDVTFDDNDGVVQFRNNPFEFNEEKRGGSTDGENDEGGWIINEQLEKKASNRSRKQRKKDSEKKVSNSDGSSLQKTAKKERRKKENVVSHVRNDSSENKVAIPGEQPASVQQASPPSHSKKKAALAPSKKDTDPVYLSFERKDDTPMCDNAINNAPQHNAKEEQPALASQQQTNEAADSKRKKKEEDKVVNKSYERKDENYIYQDASTRSSPQQKAKGQEEATSDNLLLPQSYSKKEGADEPSEAGSAVSNQSNTSRLKKRLKMKKLHRPASVLPSTPSFSSASTNRTSNKSSGGTASSSKKSRKSSSSIFRRKAKSAVHVVPDEEGHHGGRDDDGLRKTKSDKAVVAGEDEDGGNTPTTPPRQSASLRKTKSDGSPAVRVVSPEKEHDPDIDVYPSESDMSELSLTDEYFSSDDGNGRRARITSVRSMGNYSSDGSSYTDDAGMTDSELSAVIAGVNQKLQHRITSGKITPLSKRRRRRGGRGSRRHYSGAGSIDSSLSGGYSSHGSLLDEVIEEEGELNSSSEAGNHTDGEVVAATRPGRSSSSRRKSRQSSSDRVPVIIEASPKKGKDRSKSRGSSGGASARKGRGGSSDGVIPDPPEDERRSGWEDEAVDIVVASNATDEDRSSRAARGRRSRVPSKKEPKFPSVDGAAIASRPSFSRRALPSPPDFPDDESAGFGPRPAEIDEDDADDGANTAAWQARRVRMARIRMVRQGTAATSASTNGGDLPAEGEVIRTTQDGTFWECTSEEDSI